MKLARFDIHRYAIPTTLGFIREGLYVRIANELGKEGVGEIAPLPGRNQETLDEAIHFTKEVRGRLLKQDLRPTPLPPSVMFGMEMALLDLLSPDSPPHSVYRNKLKLKGLSLSSAITRCKQAAKPLRIDLNRAWAFDQVIEFCSHFNPSDFLYIEDPTEHFSELEQFYNVTGFPYAVDEYLSTHTLEEILSLRGLTHLIIKPTVHGGLNRCKEIVTHAKGKTCIFSSAYETSVGLKHIARIGATLSPTEPLGIDTLSIFKEQVKSYEHLLRIS